MKHGIQISSFRPVLTTEEALRTACRRMAEMGCRLVQTQWIDPGIPPETIARTFSEWEISSVSVQDFYTEVAQNLSYYTRINALTGGVWVCVSRIPEEWKAPEKLHNYTDALRAMAHTLEPLGQKLCFHPVASDFAPVNGISPAEQLTELMPELWLCGDLYHVNKSGLSINTWLKKHAGRVCMVHFKDSIIHSDGTESLVPAGQGDIDWYNVAKTCRNTGVEYAFVEQERWEGDPFLRLEEAFSWLNHQP